MQVRRDHTYASPTSSISPGQRQEQVNGSSSILQQQQQQQQAHQYAMQQHQQPSHLQSPYRPQYPSSSSAPSSSNGIDAFHTGALERSLDEAASSTTNRINTPLSAVKAAYGSTSQGGQYHNSSNNYDSAAIGAGRDSPSKYSYSNHNNDQTRSHQHQFHHSSSSSPQGSSSSALQQQQQQYAMTTATSTPGGSGSGPASASTPSRSQSTASSSSNSTAHAHQYASSSAASNSATAATTTTAAARSRNPLIDLIETEKGYVDDLALVIKKVAAAWSRSNFPPAELDKMFRAIEAVYRIDKQFLAKLNDIGPNPSSPKALGDLLMRWIDDLEPAYTKYVNAYHSGFDDFQPVQANINLQPILEALPTLNSSNYNDPTTSQHQNQITTLDTLFALPLDRLQYFKKLYAKLLKSTQPGKSDHSLLVGANEKLDWLVDASRQSGERRVGGGGEDNNNDNTRTRSNSSNNGGGASSIQQESNAGSMSRSESRSSARTNPTAPTTSAAAGSGSAPHSTRNSEEQQRLRSQPQPLTSIPEQSNSNPNLHSHANPPTSSSTSAISPPPQVVSTPIRNQASTGIHHPTSTHSSNSSTGIHHPTSTHSSNSSKASLHLQTNDLLASRPTSDGNVSAISSSSVERSSGQTTASTASTAFTSESSTIAPGLVGSQQSMNGIDGMLELEKRLDTSRTLDIFTMKPKKCKLQINPPNLTYQRTLRQAGNVQISFFPASQQPSTEVFTPSAVIYLLTDLFLLCERISDPSTETRRVNPNANLWLMYPPLATKHLKAYKSTTSPHKTAFEIEIMRKEKMTVYAESPSRRDEWLESFQEAINYGGGAGALRVNTDVARSISPYSAQAPSSAGGRSTVNSFQSVGSAGSNPSPLPPLPASASTSHFPSSSPSPHSSRAPTPQDGQALPMQNRPLPQPMQQQQQQQTPYPVSQSPGRHSPLPPQPYPHRGPSPGPGQGPMYQQQQGSQGPLPPMPRTQASLPPPPQQQQQGGSPVNGPYHQQHQQHPSMSRPLPNPQNGFGGQPSHGQYPQQQQQHQFQGSHPGQYQQSGGFPPGQYNENFPPPPQQMGSYGSMPSQMQADGMSNFPSTRSMGSFSSGSSKKSMTPNSSWAPSPIPPLPGKDQYPSYDWQSVNGQHQQQQMQMQPDMRNGGLLSPSRSQAGMSANQDPRLVHRSKSAEGLRNDQYRMPSAVLKDSMRGQSLPSQGGPRSLPGSRLNSGYVNNVEDDISPPTSPRMDGPVTNQLAAQMKCKVFVQSAKSQWKSLGTAKLKLYLQSPGNRKQLVVEDKTVLISTIVLEDGVERVGKTGVAIELSDNGQRTGLIYMLQLKTEASATGLFQQLLLGSTRASAMALK